MEVVEEVLEAVDIPPVKEGCRGSLAYSEEHHAVFFLDQTRATKVGYVGLDPASSIQGDAGFELDVRGAEEGIQSMTFNSTCSMLLLGGAHVSVVRVDQRLREDLYPSFKGTVLFRGMSHQTEVIQAAWHPLSAYHVVALVRGGGGGCALHIYGLPEHGDLTNGKTEHIIPISLDAFRDVENPNDWVSFAFGPVGAGSGWERFTIYLLHGAGHIFALCPVIPAGCKVAREAVVELYSMIPTTDDDAMKDGEAEAALDVLRKFFPTFDPDFPRTGLVECRLPRNYLNPVPQLMHVNEAIQENIKLKASHLTLLNPDGSLAILAVSEWDGTTSSSSASSSTSPSSPPRCRVDVGVLLHVIHPGFVPGKWSREAQGKKSIAQLDFSEWATSRPPTVLIDRLQLGIIYVVLSDTVFKAVLPIVSKVDAHKHVSYGQWTVKEPTATELVPDRQRSSPQPGSGKDIIGVCIASKLEGGSSTSLYVRKRGGGSFQVNLSEASEPYNIRNILELQSTRQKVAKKLLGDDGSPSMLMAANKQTQALEQKVKAAKGLLDQNADQEQLMSQVVGPRRWLEMRMFDRISEITTTILSDQEGRIRKLKEEIGKNGDIKGLREKAAELGATLSLSAEQLNEIGKGIGGLRSTMTPQEKQAKQALEVAEKRLARLEGTWQRIKQQVTSGIESQVGKDASLEDKLSALSLQRRDDTAQASEESRLLTQLKEGANRVERLLGNLEDRTEALGEVVKEEGAGSGAER